MDPLIKSQPVGHIDLEHESSGTLDIPRSREILNFISLDTSEQNRGYAKFQIKNKHGQITDCGISWDLIIKPQQPPILVIRTLCGHFIQPPRLLNESDNKYFQRLHNLAAKHDGSHSYWLLEYLREQIKDSDSQLSKILKPFEQGQMIVRVQFIGYKETDLAVDTENFDLNSLGQNINTIQLYQARLASGPKFWNGFTPLDDLRKYYPFLTVNEQYVAVNSYKPNIQFAIGELLEPITGSPLGRVTPSFSIINDPSGVLCLYGHYNSGWDPKGYDANEMNLMLAEQLGVKIPDPNQSHQSEQTKLVVPKIKIDYIQVAIDTDVEDASHLLSDGNLPKVIDGKLKWNDKSLERKEVFDPETNKSLGFVYRSVVLNKQTQSLEFRFFRTKSEAAAARVSKASMDELIKEHTAELNKSPSQKLIEELGKHKNTASSEQMLIDILEIELDKKTPITDRIVNIEPLNIIWSGASEESSNPIFYNRIRQIAFNSDTQQIPQLIKAVRAIDESLKTQSQLSTHGPSSLSNIFLSLEILKAIQKVCSQEQSTTIENVISKLNKTFEHKYSKAGPWAKTEVPLIRKLSEMRIKYALPELYD